MSNRTFIKMDKLIDEISMGPFGSNIKVEFFVKSGVPVLNGSNISSIKLSESFSNYVTRERAATYGKAVATRGDIVITHRGTLGQIAYIPEDSKFEEYVISQSQFKVRLKPNLVNYIYFVYYFHTNEGQKRLLSFKNHVGVPALAQATTNFRLLDFPLIAKEKQDLIAHTLETIDQKIELNNKINSELESMAKLLYDYWFIQFDFPDQDGKPYKSSGGKMVYNKKLKQEIPEGWITKPIKDWIALDNTGDWGKESSQGKYTVKVNCLRGTDLDGFNSNNINAMPVRYIHQNNKHKLLKPYNLIIEISGGSPTQSTGRISYLTHAALERFDTPFICSNFCKSVSLKDNSYFYNFIHMWEKLYENNILFRWEGKTSGIKNLLFDSFIANHYECFPPKNIVTEFFNFSNQLDIQIQNLLNQNRVLIETRDWLLPMLMNGQVTVEDN